MIVTFDLFSALTDSRTGGSYAFAVLADKHGWEHSGLELFNRWDRHNKTLQRTARPPVTFHDLSRHALEQTYRDLDLDEGSLDADLTAIETSVGDWPLWPDVADAVQAVARIARVGILSNVDDVIARRTHAFALVEPELVLTSEKLGAYKPSPQIYQRAVAAVAPEPLVHVAASGRDVRGALEAGLTTVRLVRPGHVLDDSGPRPTMETDDAADLPGLLDRL